MVGHLSVQTLCIPLCHCARVALVITFFQVHPYKQTVEQDRNYTTIQPVFHALDVLASRCRIHALQTTLKITVLYLDA